MHWDNLKPEKVLKISFHVTELALPHFLEQGGLSKDVFVVFDEEEGDFCFLLSMAWRRGVRLPAFPSDAGSQVSPKTLRAAIDSALTRRSATSGRLGAGGRLDLRNAKP